MNLKTQIFLHVFTLACVSQLSADQTIRVAMRSTHVSVSQPELLVGDVCTIEGGSPQLRDQISALDLDTLNPGKKIVVSKRQVAVRVALANVLSKSIQPSGPDSTEVELIRNEDLQRKLEAKVTAEVSRQFGIQLSDVRVRLLDSKILDQLRDAIDTTRFQVMAFFSAQVPLGDKYVQVEVTDVLGNRVTQKMHFHIVVLREVFVTSTVVPKGSVIAEQHIRKIKRPLIERSAEPAGVECFGCTATRDIPAHEVITTRHLGRRPTVTAIGVKRNDLVDIVVTRGPLTVRIKNAKVLSGGAKGQTVRVLNTNSNRQVSAVVLDASTVVVKN